MEAPVLISNTLSPLLARRLAGQEWLKHNGGRASNRHPGYPWKYMRMCDTQENLKTHSDVSTSNPLSDVRGLYECKNTVQYGGCCQPSCPGYILV